MFLHPFNAIISGPSQCGKTEWVKKLIDNCDTMIQPKPEKIIWYYALWQAWYPTYSTKVQFIQGLPSLEDFGAIETNKIAIVDDQMSETNDVVEKMFTKFSHQLNLSNIILCQNLFFNGKHQRTMSLNSHYLIIFRNPRDVTQVRILGSQIFGKKGGQFLLEALADATKNEPFGHIILDLKPTTEENLRVLTRIFSSPKEYPIAYIKK